MKYNQLTRLFVNQSLEETNVCIHSMMDINYLTKVLRQKIKDQLLIFNEHNGEYLAEILEITNKKIILNILHRVRVPSQEQEIKLIFAPIKQSRIQFLIEKATELGVTEFQPIITKYSVVEKINYDKWLIYIKEAVEQSRRLSMPKIHKIINFYDLITHWPEQEKLLFCNEKEKNCYFSKEKSNEKINILIGPEGGFSEQERDFFS